MKLLRIEEAKLDDLDLELLGLKVDRETPISAMSDENDQTPSLERS